MHRDIEGERENIKGEVLKIDDSGQRVYIQQSSVLTLQLFFMFEIISNKNIFKVITPGKKKVTEFGQ